MTRKNIAFLFPWIQFIILVFNALLLFESIWWGLLFVIFPILYALLHMVHYGPKGIKLYSIRGCVKYDYRDFSRITPLYGDINLYKMVFSDGKEYAFGIRSSRYLLTVSATETAAWLEKKLHRYFNELADKK